MDINKLIEYYYAKYKSVAAVARALKMDKTTISYHLGFLKCRRAKTLARFNREFTDYLSEIRRIDYRLEDPVKYGRYMRVRFIREFGFEPNLIFK
jgi:hypothetical protein